MCEAHRTGPPGVRVPAGRRGRESPVRGVPVPNPPEYQIEGAGAGARVVQERQQLFVGGGGQVTAVSTGRGTAAGRGVKDRVQALVAAAPASPRLVVRPQVGRICGVDAPGGGLPQVVPPLDRPLVGKGGQDVEPADAVTHIAAQRLAGLFLVGAAQCRQDSEGEVWRPTLPAHGRRPRPDQPRPARRPHRPARHPRRRTPAAGGRSTHPTPNTPAMLAPAAASGTLELEFAVPATKFPGWNSGWRR